MKLFHFAPALLIAAFYLLFLGHRSDYAGHYMAGFGGTLFAIMACAEIGRERERHVSNGPLVAIVFLSCVVFGTLLEATTFRLAKFDEVDYCSQNLGAAVAALSSLGMLPESGADRSVIGSSLFVGMIFLIAGFFYAFA